VLYYGSLALAGGALIYYSRWRTRAEQRARAEQLARRRARKSAEK
jgi:hypothetical protein